MDQNKAYVMDYHFQTDLFSTYFALYSKQTCKMSQSINERQRQMILYYWEEGIREAPKIQSLTKIPMRTIYYNLKKIRQKGDVTHRGGNGRKKIITNIDACRIGQYVRRNPTISTKLIASKLKEEGTVVSRVTVGRHLYQIYFHTSHKFGSYNRFSRINFLQASFSTLILHCLTKHSVKCCGTWGHFIPER